MYTSHVSQQPLGVNGKGNWHQDERCCGIITGNIRTARRVGQEAPRPLGGWAAPNPTPERAIRHLEGEVGEGAF